VTERRATERLGVALIGAGGIGSTYATALASHNTGLIARAVVDTDRSRADAAAATLGAASFERFERLLEDPVAATIGAVVVCTPPHTHEQIVVAAADAGLSILCEKPIALDSASLARMYTAVDTNGLVLMMASKFRYVDDVARLREMIVAGDIGEPVLFRNAFTSRVDMRNRWNSKRALAGGGVIIDNGTHSVDIARFLAGPIVSITAIVSPKIQGMEVEDTAQMLLRTASGVSGTIDLSWSLASGSEWYVTVDGTDASVRLGWHTAELNRGDGWAEIGNGYSKTEAFNANLRDFAEAVVHRTTPRISRADIHSSVSVIDAAYLSLKTMAWVNVVERRAGPERS
jgi:predicted dehydrogenase